MFQKPDTDTKPKPLFVSESQKEIGRHRSQSGSDRGSIKKSPRSNSKGF